MTDWVRQVLERYGQDVTVDTADGERTVRAFLQPMTERDERARSDVTSIGWVDGRLWLYLGQTALEEGEALAWEATRFRAVPLLGGAGTGAGGGGMRELSQIRDAVVSTLAAEGMAALDAYPDQRARRYGCPVAAVAVETAESRTVGFCNYLGEVFDTGAGAPRELYGKQLEAVISIEIRGQRAADCEQGCETAAEVLLERLPAGIRPGELNWEALTWERETGLFLRRGRLRCRAYFLARAEEGDTVFLDFRLKGAVTT